MEEMSSNLEYNKKTCSVENLDRFSYLQNELIDEIIKHLPIRDAVKTSLLSRSWKYRWRSTPNLIFDAAASINSKKGIIEDTELVTIVNNVLLLHEGMVSNFTIYKYLEGGCSDVDKWIAFVSLKNTLTHLVLVLKRSDSYLVPTCLCTCQNLHELKLGGCELRLSSQFNGFSRLNFLKLTGVNITSGTIESLVMKSPLFLCLKIWKCKSLTSLNINSPNLRKFVIKGACESLKFQNTPKLVYAGIRIWPPGLFPSTSFRLEEALGRLDEIQQIFIDYPFTELSPINTAREGLQGTYSHLKSVTLCVNFEDSKQILAVLCLCRSAPYLKELDIFAAHNRKNALLYEEDFWTERSQEAENIFTHLKFVRARFKGVQHELGFVQFILLNSLVLENLTIKWSKFFTDDYIDKILQFKRASPEVKVTFSRLVHDELYENSIEYISTIGSVKL
ncbi:hypothetical protein IFM89_026976 [Coptis chinensis]|uniref:F-box/FBD/LRR-repeat protein n=1 Tax=Coptis chinensis TaxID=261450 RepID=A0A835H726_9MAGN|nr:hypothetical protein IFM89_026976 [Coptis chinensis]